MRKYSNEQIMERIKGMSPISPMHVGLVKSEPVLVVEPKKTYWAILDNSELTTPSGKKSCEEVISQNGVIYIICGAVSTEE